MQGDVPSPRPCSGRTIQVRVGNSDSFRGGRKPRPPDLLRRVRAILSPHGGKVLHAATGRRRGSCLQRERSTRATFGSAHLAIGTTADAPAIQYRLSHQKRAPCTRQPAHDVGAKEGACRADARSAHCAAAGLGSAGQLPRRCNECRSKDIGSLAPCRCKRPNNGKLLLFCFCGL
jgi:hypothetical protein